MIILINKKIIKNSIFATYQRRQFRWVLYQLSLIQYMYNIRKRLGPYKHFTTFHFAHFFSVRFVFLSVKFTHFSVDFQKCYLCYLVSVSCAIEYIQTRKNESHFKLIILIYAVKPTRILPIRQKNTINHSINLN